MLRPALQLKQSSLCGLHLNRDRGRGGPNGQIISINRTADGRRQKSWKIINEEREKYRAKNGSLWNTLTDFKEMTCDFERPHKRAYHKGKIESVKQNKEGGQLKQVCKKG